jgi:hypothetical protein
MMSFDNHLKKIVWFTRIGCLMSPTNVWLCGQFTTHTVGFNEELFSV